MRIATWQTSSVGGDVPANLSALEDQVRRCSGEGVDLLITPETFTTGYDIGPALQQAASFDFLSELGRIAADHGVALVVGTVLTDPDGALSNCAVLIDAAGTVVATHRKAHLFGDLDRSTFRAGPDAVTFGRLGDVTIAMMICYDVEFPESVRLAALGGADLVAVPTAQMEPFAFTAEHLIPVRAWENQVFVAYANHVGTERNTTYVGRSHVAAPDGRTLALGSPDREQLLIVDIDVAEVRAGQRENPYLSDRRPKLYAPLARTTEEDAP